MLSVTLPIVVHVIVEAADGQVLLLERANTGFMDGYFSLPGGHLQEEEDIVAAARRECLEESGLRLIELQPSSVMPFRGGIDFLFHSSVFEGCASVREPKKCSNIGWFSPGGLPTNTAPFVAKALELHEQGIWFHQFVE